jgi:hypothetical protein
MEHVRGIFGDPYARVITLSRRSKKRSATRAAGNSRAGTIAGVAGCETLAAAAYGSSSMLRCGASIAAIAAR